MLMAVDIAMAAVKQSGAFLEENENRKSPMLKVFEEFETDRESYGSSSSEDVENYSPKSVVSKVRKSLPVKDIDGDVFGRCVHSQIVRIQAEDSHLGEDIGECLIAIAMTAVKKSSDFLEENDNRKTPMLKVFEEFETDRESYGSSSSEDIENYSPKSVKDIDVDVFRRCVHSQIVRIRAEDSHLGEDIGECLIAKVSGAGYDLEHDNDMIFSRPASPLSGKFSPK